VNRSATLRSLARMAVIGSLATTALVAPAAASAGGPLDDDCAGYDFYLKIDNVGNGGVENGSYTDGTPNVPTNWDGQTITVTDSTGQAFDWAATRPVDQVFVKFGTDSFIAAGGLAGHVDNDDKNAISHVTFCGNEPEATPTPEPEPTPTPEPEVTPTPEPEVTPTPEPTGSVAVETGTPNVTPPSTDTIEPQGPSSTNSTPILLFLGALVALAALVTPSARAKSRPR
jgi:hypothetical protein